VDSSDVLSTTACLPEDGDAQPQLLFIAEPHQDELPNLIRAETVSPILEFPDLTSLASQASESTTILKGPSTEENARAFAQDWKLPLSLLQEAVVSALMLLGERGDVQSCALLVLALESQLELPAETMARWIYCYITILQKMKLFTAANDVIRACPPSVSVPFLNYGDPIATLNRKATMVAPRPNPQKPGRPSIVRCCLCNMPVRGVYVQCQGCGHGGHLEHLRSWFDRNFTCPTGCSHLCHLCPVTISPLQTAQDPTL
jgi:hypothetical protein